jgi:bifunctional DNA-binding transcriptional regulator/antitoxin component of YhaV-PrlF toxin-antitoxin module
MTTILTSERHIVLPKKLCSAKKLRTGDHFEVVADEDDPNVIKLRRLEKAPQDDLLEVLLACPVKGFMPRIKRRKEPMRKVRL